MLMQLRFAEMSWFGQDAGGLHCDGEGRNRLSNVLSGSSAALGGVQLSKSSPLPCLVSYKGS